jgi:signal transduction histidine kinase
MDIPEDLRVAADPDDLTELFGNLLDNGCKWARATITVEARQNDDKARIQILDDGPGAPEAALASLVDRGVRLDESVPGTGLGLAIARDIATACQGAMTVSNRPGGGFCATVELPTSSKSIRDA